MDKFVKRLIAFLLGMKTDFVFKRKISGIYKNVSRDKSVLIPGDILRNYNLNWSDFRIKGNLKWLKTYITINDYYSPDYVPENIYYSEIEPRLNFKSYSKVFTDKNFYDLHLKGIRMPGVLLRNLDGVFYDSEFNKLDLTRVKEELLKWEKRKVIIKPTIDTGGGSNVRLAYWEGDKFGTLPALKTETFESLFTYYKKDFIVQEYINQYRFFMDFNESSLNTIRILTYRSVGGESIHIIHRVLRSGRPGMIVDNQSSGGVVCGITEEGIIDKFAVDKLGNKYNVINGINLSSVGPVPFIDEISECAKQVAKQFYYSRLLGLDFCVDSFGQIIFLEVNDVNNEINFYQMTNGPLFGRFTNEIIAYCSNRPKSVVLDFNI